MRNMRLASRSLVVAAAITLAACDKNPVTTPPPSGGSPAVLVATRLEIQGPRDLAPRASAQFRAIAQLEDGSTRDVTNEASWLSGTPLLLTVGRGLVTASGTLGDAAIKAFYGSQSASAEVIVVPAGTYRLIGTVTEAGSNGYGVSDALIDVSSAAGLLTTRTAFNGEYRLYGVSGTTEIRILKEAYDTLVKTFDVTSHERVEMQLAPQIARTQVGGAYTLIITASDACRSQLPAEAMERRYHAVVTQVGPRLTVALQGDTFASGVSGPRNRFYGRIETTRPQFDLLDFFEDPSCSMAHECYIEADVLEQIGGGKYFSPTGRVTPNVAPSGMSGSLSGTVYVRNVEGGRFPAMASCKSDGHWFELKK